MNCNFPDRLTAGLPLNHLMTFAAYPASQGWAVRVIVRGPSAFDLTATAEADQHRFTRTVDETSAWQPGKHHFSLRAVRGLDAVEIEFGQVTIDRDLALLEAGSDMRTHAEITLENIKAVIEKRATQDQQKYVIRNRELWRTPLLELMKFKAHYQDLVNAEQARANGRSGWGRSIKVRFK